ncbi:MAG: ATP-dependent protease ATPase subunit HslU [Planctomycetes bacterium]|nr:ATP-dependent protease ATPase subunit HslU [Planctomycetota bacterium]
MENMTPQQIVAELDRFIIGQSAAKRAVAVAIRNRWRRQQLDPATAREVNPKNIIMVGPTGVGKTEIARRIAQMTSAPFIKVEASKFTEVGYHGRDVESMIRDLLEQGIQLVRVEFADKVREKAEAAVEERLLDLLLPKGSMMVHAGSGGGGTVDTDDSVERREQARARLLEQLRAGKLEDRPVTVTIHSKSVPVAMFSNMGLDQMDPQMSKMFENLIPDQTQSRRMPIAEARQVLLNQETESMIDREKLTEEAIARTEQQGIIFLDEIDKIATAEGSGKGGPDVSRQGVQRDLLPIVEGSAVTTRHGIVNTDHILFIAAGAFHSAAVSDLMPELQGRFPIRVELDALTKADFVRILREPHNALTRQQQALLNTEGLEVVFEDGAIEAMAELAAQANEQMENIGARRLMTIMERLFEDTNFDAPDMVARGVTKLTITPDHVRRSLASIIKDEDLSRFVL